MTPEQTALLWRAAQQSGLPADSLNQLKAQNPYTFSGPVAERIQATVAQLDVHQGGKASDLNAIIEPTTLRIAGYIGSSSCDAFDSFKVVETDDQVEITVLVSSKQPGPCTMDMRIESIDVVLAEPLGERELTGCLPFEARPGEPNLGCRTIIPYP